MVGGLLDEEVISCDETWAVEEANYLSNETSTRFKTATGASTSGEQWGWTRGPSETHPESAQAERSGSRRSEWRSSSLNAEEAGAASKKGSSGAAAGGGAGDAGKALHMTTAVANLPHPEKAHKGGEDAWFIAEDGMSFGVADGVGGWAEHGVDPAEYARQLMAHCKEALLTEQPCGAAPKRALKRAHLRTRVMGSSTACVSILCGDTLHIANLGDSGVSIVRGGEVVFSTPPQQHDFNFPFQLGSDGINDPPEDAQEFAVKLQSGDVLITATDGLWDNLWGNEICDLVSEAKKRKKGPKALANVLANHAQKRGMDQTAWSPFMHGALQRGFGYMGGKLDDITIAVSYLSADNEKETKEKKDKPASKM